ncbi:hypothetical protein ACT3CE_18855, partial [Marinifilum sp. RC60d5]|uniref:hypothetical protein n=1 Tax=Marinifilum sp. RC60d5 TaxID=3458414 RepID=UPI004036F686
DTSIVLLDSTFCRKWGFKSDEKEALSVQFAYSYKARKLVKTKDSIKISLKECSKTFKPAIVDLTSFPAYKKREIFTVLGFQLMKHKIIELNLKEGYLRLHDNIDKDSLKSCNLLEQENGSFNIEIALMVNDSTRITGEVGIDPGINDFLVTGVQGHQKVSKSLNSKRVVFDYSYGRGFSMDFYRVPVVDLCGYKMKNNMVHNFGYYFTNPNSLGYVGLDFLKKFILYFDLAHNKLYLKPSKCFHDHENRKINSFIISSNRTMNGNKILLKGLLRSNYIKEVGLELNDEIVELNGIPQASLSQNKVDSIVFNVEVGQEFNFLIKRKGKLIRK